LYLRSMGVNTTIIIVKPLGDMELNTAEILKGLRVPATIEQEDLDFENTLSRLWDRSSVGATAATTYKGKIIFVDNAHNIDVEAIPKFTSAYPGEVLRVDYSDTVEAGEFSFWVEGVLVRKATSGMEKWMDDLEEMGITDKDILSSCKPVDIGTPLEFEKESSHPMTVLATYAVDYSDFYNLRWTIFRIIR
jgi:hypothetical protein